MTNTPLDELGPVDYVIVEFPEGHQHFTGEMVDELLKLSGLLVQGGGADERDDERLDRVDA